MKNLRLYRHSTCYLPNLGNVQHFCVDISNNVYFYFNDHIYRLSRENDTTKEVDLRQFCKASSSPHVVGFTYIVGLNCVCVCIKEGDVLTFDCDTKEVQCVGFVENEVKAMEWSPDQEVVVLVTGLDTLIVMTSTFDPITEVTVHQNYFGEKQFINVGWGKKETQFHGSECKSAAHQSTNVESQTASPNDTRLPSVSWRGDGALFAVTLFDSLANMRHLYVFSREGVLQYTGENVPGLEMTLAWRPSGNLIASTQIFQNKYQVIFFEKNGLRHGEFVLPFAVGDGKVLGLSWNVESTVLAVTYQDANNSYLQLWTSSNYHWYMKQCLTISNDQQLLNIQWDTEVGLRLHTIFSGLFYTCFEWIWSTNHSYTSALDNRAYVAVIDGCNLLLSSFHDSIIPPPLCKEKLLLPVPVNEVVFGPESDSNSLCAILCDGRVAVFKGEEKHTLLMMGHITWACQKPDSFGIPELHHWLWLSHCTLLCVCTVGSLSHLIIINMDNDGHLTARSAINAGDIVISVAPIPTSLEALIQLNNRNLLLYKTEEDVLLEYGKLPEPYIQLHVYRGGDSNIVLGLTSRNRLYVESKEIANNITSLFLHPKFLLLTTSHHRLQCLQLTSVLLLEQIPGRRIERGAKLVIVVGNRVVLQMPRGNLECITPRPLVLYEASWKLNLGQYHEVFNLFRSQRINLNLLVDHNPEQFLTDVDKFVEEISPSWLSLFLMELSEEDVTLTMYSHSYQPNRENAAFSPNKVASICDQVRAAMLARPDASKYLLPIIASHIRKNSEKDLAAALSEVKAAGKGEISQDEALNYLLLMVDVDKLYNVALGLYDFQLVLMVAAKSNKDPKEYGAFLKDLQKMENNYQRYTIDKYLKRYSSALDHIALCPNHFDECLELVKSQNLYLKALQLFPRESNNYCEVAAAFADHLMDQKKYTEAAIMYQRGQQLPKALEASRMAVNWREAVLIMSQLGYSESETDAVCQKLASALVQQQQYQEAAQLLSQHVNHIERSVDVLVQGHYWEEALRVAQHANRQDLEDTCIKPGVDEHFEQLHRQLISCMEQFLNYKKRLAVVRSIKKIQQEALNNEVRLHEESDLYSDTGSNTSLTLSSQADSKISRHSSRSSKNRRKLERKLMSLKEGSPYEDLALIRALHHLMTSCLDYREEVRNLCCILLKFDRDMDAANLQLSLSNLLDVMENSKEEIWPPETFDQQNYGPEMTVNSILAQKEMSFGLENGLTFLEPIMRKPPTTLNKLNWEMTILKLP